MVQIVVEDKNGVEHALDATEYNSGYETVRDLLEDEIDDTNFAICGGSMCCATCHVYVDGMGHPKWGHLVLPSKEESIMLESLGVNIKDNSRLSCQIPINDNLDGVRFIIAQE